MLKESTVTSTSLEDEIFDLLKRRGPLCASQIVVEAGQSPRAVKAALEQLSTEGLVEPRPDRNQSLHQEDETPWGLAKPSWPSWLSRRR